MTFSHTDIRSDGVVRLNDKTIAEFEGNLIKVGNKSFFYADIDSIGYTLTQFTYTLYHILPLYNSTSFVFSFTSGKKITTIRKVAPSPFFFKGQRHKDIENTYGQLVNASKKHMQPLILKSLVTRIKNGETLHFGSLSISESSVKTKSGFAKSKELYQYGESNINYGYVNIFDKNGKHFDSVQLTTNNAPLIPYILNYFFK